MFLLLLPVLVCNVYAGFSPDWSKCKADADAARGTVWFRESGRMAAFISIKPAAALADLKYSFKDGTLEVDTRDMFAKNPKSSLVFRLRELPFEPALKLKTVFLELDIAGEPSGLKGKLYFEGNGGADKKHYWKAQNFVLGDKVQTLHFEQTLPGNLNQLTLRCDLDSPGLYRFGAVRFGEVKTAAVDPAKNHIANGGAEKGWYNIGVIDAKVLAMADDGKIYNGYGKKYDKSKETVIDNAVRHSGNSSFRLSSDARSDGRFAFNSVPFAPGRPAVFSVWLKADNPKTSVGLSLFLSSGIAYGKRVTAGTEWKRYELMIPAWGENISGVSKVGDVVNGYGAVYKMVTPMVSVENGTIWVDDAVYQLNGQFTPVTAPEVAVRGKLNNAQGYYVAGQPIRAEFVFRSDRAVTVPVKWELRDFFGRKVAEADAGTVSLKPGEEATGQFELAAPPELRGALNWTFAVGEIKHNFYFGIIGAAQPQLPRLGINYDSRQNAATAIAMLRDFRFGSVRLWSNFRKLAWHGFRDVPYFKQGGFTVMMCVDFGDSVPNFMVPLDFSSWQQELKTAADKVKGQVAIYEILNESNIWHGRVANPDPKKYQEMTAKANAATIVAAAAALQAVDPAVKIAGPTSCHTDINWTANVLAFGADKVLDYITEHPYRELPELPDYADDLGSMRRMVDRYRPGLPVIASEAGERAVSLPSDNRILDLARDRAAYNVRMMLIGLGNGLEQYHHFAMDQTGLGTGWTMVLAGNPDSAGLSLPAPVMFALRNLADRIGMGRPVGRVKLGSDYRCYIFDRGDCRVAVLWKWNGKPEQAVLPAGAAARLTAFDFMGTRIGLDKLTLDKFPVYLESTLAATELEKLIAATTTTVSGAPLDAQLEVSGFRTFGIKLRNRTGRPVGGSLRILTPGVVSGKADAAFPAIAPEGVATVALTAADVIGPVDRRFKVEIAAAGYPVEVREFNLKSILVRQVAQPLVIDGNLADWPQAAAPLKLTSANAVKLKGWTAADDRITAEIRLAWDDDYLYLAVRSNKKDNIQNRISPSSLFGGDGVQIAFDPLRNADVELKGYQDDDYEFSAGLFKDRPLVFMHHAAAAVYDSVDKQLGIAPSVKCAVKTTGAGTVYELAFPRLLVSPFRLQPNSAMRFNVILNVNNGTGRAGWLELTPGIGQTPKTPGLFMDIVLIK